MNYIKEYWNKIESGDILVNELIYLQMKSLIDDLNNPKTVKYIDESGDEITETYVFDEKKANRPIEFMETFCKHSKAPWTGKPVKLELWQKARIQAAYGFVEKNTGLRQYSECSTFVGRKNGKTTEAGGLGLYNFIADGEGGAEIYSVATKKDIARKSFGEACNMVSQSQDLKKAIKKRKSDLYFPATFSEFKPLASDADTLDGLNGSFVIADEIHAWKTRDLYDVLVQSFGARNQPLMWIISTMGFIRESIADSIIDKAEKILRGIYPRDYKKLYFIYALDNKDEIEDSKKWVKANPGLGTIKKFNYLKNMVNDSKTDPKLLPTVLTKDFNIIETIAGSWLSFSLINNKLKYADEYLKSTYAVGGVDLSSKIDLTCATLLIKKPDDPMLYVKQMYFMPENLLLEREKDDSVPYKIWKDQGLITTTPGNRVDYDYVYNWYVNNLEENDITPLWIGYDPWHAEEWVKKMTAYGFKMLPVRQGYQSLSGPMKDLEGLFMDGTINYNDNKILKWCLTNTNAKYDENQNMRPIKGQNQKLRIDGVVSLIIAYAILKQHMQDYENMI